jgi:hypothetical protein
VPVDRDGAAAAVIDTVDSGDDDDDVRELDEFEDRELIQELLGREMGYAKKRGDLREHLGFKAIARY